MVWKWVASLEVAKLGHPSAQILWKIEFIRVVLILQLGQPESFRHSEGWCFCPDFLVGTAWKRQGKPTSVVSCLKPQDVCVCHLDMNYGQRSLTFQKVSPVSIHISCGQTMINQSFHHPSRHVARSWRWNIQILHLCAWYGYGPKPSSPDKHQNTW